ncbi:MAG: LysM peptidoglycan-binding domain-containing protein [Pseudomonadota bacterium]|nr:LysM peptidoglycan-binding domain-containing protein [Pseudomonadota bacterium]
MVAAWPTPPPKPARPSQPTSYKVQRGDTLSSVARQQGCAVGDIAKANRLKAPGYAIRPGQTLSLQGCRE